MSVTNEPQPREGGPYEHATSAPTKRLTREDLAQIECLARTEIRFPTRHDSDPIRAREELRMVQEIRRLRRAPTEKGEE